jgi:hypothetical protein
MTLKLKELPKAPTLAQQIELLKRSVEIKSKDFYGKRGIIVSLKEFDCYKILLDVPYKGKNGDWRRIKYFSENEIMLLS